MIWGLTLTGRWEAAKSVLAPVVVVYILPGPSIMGFTHDWSNETLNHEIGLLLLYNTEIKLDDKLVVDRGLATSLVFLPKY